MIDPAIIGSIADNPRSSARDSRAGCRSGPSPGPCGVGNGGSDGVPGDSWADPVGRCPEVCRGSSAPVPVGCRVLANGAGCTGGGGTGHVQVGVVLGLGLDGGSGPGSDGVGEVTVGNSVGSGGDSVGSGGASIGGSAGGASIGAELVGRGGSLVTVGRGAGLSLGAVLGSGGSGVAGGGVGPAVGSGFGSSRLVADGPGRGLSAHWGAHGSSLGWAKAAGAASRVATNIATTPHPATRDHRPS